ncbi:MAG: hypothetical protein IPM53_10735 [Anaerolineaceae bacterium]|nr:hypothetical protein [Anaerolineaceae bacterium]
MPDLDFCVEQAAVRPYAAAPTLQFKLTIQNHTPEKIHSVMLKVQVQIVTTQRHYNGQEQAQLLELFGTPERWGKTLKNLFWTQTVVLVPAFNGRTTLDVDIPCTYDFDVVSAKYFHALDDGVIPLEFLFSGTLFYAGPMGLQAEQIPWDKEAAFRLPVALWQEMMAHYFPDSAWLRLRQDVFNRLFQYKAARSLPTWEAALAELLDGAVVGER